MMRNVAVSTAIMGILGAVPTSQTQRSPIRLGPKSTVWLTWPAATAVSRMPDGMASRTPINSTRSAFNQTLNTEAVGRTAMTPASRSNAVRPLACRLAR